MKRWNTFTYGPKWLWVAIVVVVVLAFLLPEGGLLGR